MKNSPLDCKSKSHEDSECGSGTSSCCREGHLGGDMKQQKTSPSGGIKQNTSETSKESLQLVMNCACLFEMKSHETA